MLGKLWGASVFSSFHCRTAGCPAFSRDFAARLACTRLAECGLWEGRFGRPQGPNHSHAVGQGWALTIFQWALETRRVGSPSLLACGVVSLLLTHCGGTGPSGSLRAPEAAPNVSATPRCPATVSAPPPVLACSATAGAQAPLVDDFNDGDLRLPSNEQRVGAWYDFTDNTTGVDRRRAPQRRRLPQRSERPHAGG